MTETIFWKETNNGIIWITGFAKVNYSLKTNWRTFNSPPSPCRMWKAWWKTGFIKLEQRKLFSSNWILQSGKTGRSTPKLLLTLDFEIITSKIFHSTGSIQNWLNEWKIPHPSSWNIGFKKRLITNSPNYFSAVQVLCTTVKRLSFPRQPPPSLHPTCQYFKKMHKFPEKVHI